MNIYLYIYMYVCRYVYVCVCTLGFIRLQNWEPVGRVHGLEFGPVWGIEFAMMMATHGGA